MGNVADRIRTLRIARGLNQGQLADMIGVGRTAISNYEKGLRVPDLETAERLAEAFGISFGDFVDGYDQTRGGNDSLLPSNVRPISSLHRQRVPLIGSVAAGEPIYDPEELGVYVDSPVDADAAITIRGDSMNSTNHATTKKPPRAIAARGFFRSIPPELPAGPPRWLAAIGCPPTRKHSAPSSS